MPLRCEEASRRQRGVVTTLPVHYPLGASLGKRTGRVAERAGGSGRIRVGEGAHRQGGDQEVGREADDMSNANKNTLRTLYDAFAKGDVPTVMGLLADN